MADALIVADGLGRTYAGAVPTVALEDVSFTLEAGEFAAIGLLDFAADRRAHAEDDTTTNASPGDMID